MFRRFFARFGRKRPLVNTVNVVLEFDHTKFAEAMRRAGASSKLLNRRLDELGGFER